MFVKAANLPAVAKEFAAMLCWLSEAPLDRSRKYLVKHTTRTVKCSFSSIDYRVDVNTLAQLDDPMVHMNDIAHVSIKVQQPLVVDDYQRNRASGGFIVIDEFSNKTVAAGIICASRKSDGAVLHRE